VSGERNYSKSVDVTGTLITPFRLLTVRVAPWRETSFTGVPAGSTSFPY